MTHKIYCFLLDLPNTDDDDTMIDVAVDIFEEVFRPKLDENNYCQKMAIVTREGRAIPLCDERDRRNRDWLYKAVVAVPQDQRWDLARLHTLQGVAFDFDWEDVPPPVLPPPPVLSGDYRVDYDALLAHLLSAVPPVIADLWSKGALLIGEPAIHSADGGRGLLDDRQLADQRQRYRRQFMSRNMSQLINAIDHKHDPFVLRTASFDDGYRAFGLIPASAFEDGEGVDVTDYGNAILFVDVHS